LPMAFTAATKAGVPMISTREAPRSWASRFSRCRCTSISGVASNRTSRSSSAYR
jgi:hypothetical protein